MVLGGPMGVQGVKGSVRRFFGESCGGLLGGPLRV